MAYPTKFFSSNMQGAASLLGGTAGSMISVIDNCLINGFGTLTLTSLTYNSGTGLCTGTISGGHAYLKYSILTIAGANESGFNGDVRILTVTSTTFTYTPLSTPSASTATGTVTSNVTPIGGWTKQFSATGKGVYKSTDGDATGLAILIDQANTATGWNTSSTASAKIDFAESFTDISTAVNRWGTTGLWWGFDTSSSNTTTARNWWLVGDSKFFYFASSRGNSATYNDVCARCFGDIISIRPGDAYHCYGTATNSGASTGDTTNGTTFTSFGNSTNKYLARNYHQGPGTAGGQLATLFGHRLSDLWGYGNNAFLPFPLSVNNGLLIHDYVEVYDTYSLRGWMPGGKTIPQGILTNITPGYIFDSIPGRSGELYYMLPAFNNGTSTLNWVTLSLGSWR